MNPEIIQRVLRAKFDSELRAPIWIGRFKVPDELVKSERERRQKARAYSATQPTN